MTKSLDEVLLSRSSSSSLVEVARERRLVLESRSGPLHVDLNWVDEVAMSLVDTAISTNQDLSLLYPTPSGEVAVLIAAQVLLGRLVAGEAHSSVGIVTADPARASRTWSGLSLSTAGARRTRLEEAFPAFVADRQGRSPMGRRDFKGVLIGEAAVDWNVDYAVIDRLAGRAKADFDVPTLRLYVDPLDPDLKRDESIGRPVWAWGRESLAALNDELELDTPSTVPFSVSHDRLEAMAHQSTATIHAIAEDEIEGMLRRIREDLRYVSDSLDSTASRASKRGLQIAWHHVSTLASLPCRPSHFDRFSGFPPFAARGTHTYSKEIAAWSRSLVGSLQEIGQVLASDIEDLRWTMEDKNPYPAQIESLAMGGSGPGLVVFRTRTAAKGFFTELGSDPDSDHLGEGTIGLIRNLHRSPSHPWALATGLPSPWEWVRLGGGLTEDLHLLVIGNHDARIAERRLVAIDEARSDWANRRPGAWRALFGEEPPDQPFYEGAERAIQVLEEAPAPVDLEPLDFIESLMHGEPIRVGREGPEESVATIDTEGRWASEVEAVRVVTGSGVVHLPAGGSIEVLDGRTIRDVAVAELQPGQQLIIGRAEGRLGLLEALEDQLRVHRPDLLAARLVADALRLAVVSAFEESRLSRAELHTKLVSLGCERLEITTGNWVDPNGPMAPRDKADLKRLASAIGLEYSKPRLDESFAAVKTIRQFRRDAGRALADLAASALTARVSYDVDPRTGLSLGDLRNAVIEATVVSVSPAGSRISATRLGRLETAE